mmetsp:Transcript_59068/g.108584  ORF Transcript_59068/g.108584 Transcript_59068/m.108584 type:complete len:521 (-) Transcript_59068:48-1610(-)
METAKLSALALIPDGEQWPEIQAFRVAHDREVHKWPPHMNIFYPFVPEADFESVASALSHQLAQLKELRVRFCSMESFGGTVFLKPECDEDLGLAKLHAACKAAVPDIPENEKKPFTPHLTIGQFKGKARAEAFMQSQAAISIETRISSVCLLARDSMQTPFRTVFRVMLGGGGQVEQGDAIPYSCNTPWQWTTCQCLPACTGVAIDGIGNLTRTLSGGLARTFSGTAVKLVRSLSRLVLFAAACNLGAAFNPSVPVSHCAGDSVALWLQASPVSDKYHRFCRDAPDMSMIDDPRRQGEVGPKRALEMSDADLKDRFAKSHNSQLEFFTEFRFTDPAVCQAIAQMQDELRQVDASIVTTQSCAPNNIHFTMSEVQLQSVEDVYRVIDILEGIVASLVSPATPQSLDLLGVDMFAGRVLYAKPANNDAAAFLCDAFERMQQALVASGFKPRDRGEFVPHATLCKAQQGGSFSESFLLAVEQKGYGTMKLGSQPLVEVHFCCERWKEETTPPVIWRLQLGSS